MSWPITVTEYGDLPFKALDGAVHIRFVQCAATVANQITGGEVVASVYNDVIIGNQTAGILPVEAKRVDVHFYITVQSRNLWAAQCTLSCPTSFSVYNTWRCRLLIPTVSSSAKPIVPTPAPTR